MSEHLAKRHLEFAGREIFDFLATKVKDGTYYPARDGIAAEYCAVIPELGDIAVASTAAEYIAEPVVIHLGRYRADSRRFANYWVMKAGITAQHEAYDNHSNPYAIDERQAIHPEELIDLHSLLVT